MRSAARGNGTSSEGGSLTNTTVVWVCVSRWVAGSSPASRQRARTEAESASPAGGRGARTGDKGRDGMWSGSGGKEGF